MKISKLFSFYKKASPLLIIPAFFLNEKHKFGLFCKAEINLETNEQIPEKDAETKKAAEDVDEDLKEVMEDVTISDEEKREFLREYSKQSIQPQTFGKLSAPFKTNSDEEKWKGLRMVFDWTPNQIFKLEYTLVADSRKFFKNYKLSAMSIVPLGDRTKPLFLVGRKEGDQSLGLQAHYSLKNHKISVISNHPKPNMDQGMYALEYSYEFDRLTSAVKISNMEKSVSAVSALYKNLFVGFEAALHPKSLDLLYNYSICLRPDMSSNKFAFCLNYITAYPMVSFDFMMNPNKAWSIYFNFSKNWHQMAAMTGNSTEIKLKKNEYDVNVEVDYTGEMHLYSTYHVSKNIGVQCSLEMNPFAKMSKKGKAIFKGFGVGIKLGNTSIEEELQNLSQKDIDYDDYEEYTYEKIHGIKQS